jgi:hypothetical protein
MEQSNRREKTGRNEITMIYLVKGKQRRGKTTSAIAIALWYVMNGGYAVNEIYSNCRLYNSAGEELKTYHYLTNAQMRLFVRIMVEKAITHVIIIIDEIDRVFPHRFWNKFEQTESLIGLWQDEKLFNIIIGTAHAGKAVDALIRESLHFEVIANIDKRRKVIDLDVIDTGELETYVYELNHIELVQKLFDTRQPIR